MLSKILRSNVFISFGLFILAFIPRLLSLGRFLTADEFLWVDRSRNFLAGLTNNAYQCTTVVEKWEFATGLACTLRTGHPGVTTMWTGSFGLWLSWLARGYRTSLHDYIVGVSTNPLDANLIAPERFGTVLITSLWVVVVYWLFRRLFGAQIALAGAFLIALDPFHIALSRVIHHDALSTTFMTLSVLCAFIYWGEGKSGQNEQSHTSSSEKEGFKSLPLQGGFRGVGWLILSGILAGFGFLSKSPALYLMPFIALVGLWFMVKGVKSKEYGVGSKGDTKEETPSSFLLPPSYFLPLKRTILDGLLWFAAAIAVVFIFWPAMWVAPLEALNTVLFIGSKYATGGHAKGNFFLGVISNDPGPLFYPVSWLFRSSPLALLGVISLPITWVLSKRVNKSAGDELLNNQQATNDNSSLARQGFIIHSLPGKASSFMRYLPLILLFIAGYYLLMTIGEKKQERYFLPVYPWLNLIAAFGLVTFVNFIAAKITSRIAFYVLRFTLVIIILIVNGYLVALHFPYYFTYYNPLLGGPKSAAKVLTIGWGEGLDLAADYLNHQISPTQTRVASWYQSTFAPFYYGPAISYSKEKGKALAGDYVIFYVNQVQRRFPDDVLFDYFAGRFRPQQVITLHGIDYIWIYPGPGIDHYVEDQTYTGIASLLAWQWSIGDGLLRPGETVGFDIFWEYLGKDIDEHFFFRLVDAQNRVWAEDESWLNENYNPPIETWRDGEIIYETGQFLIPQDTPPGQYHLQIGFYTNAPAVTEGELLFNLPPDEMMIDVGHTAETSYLLPYQATPVGQPLGDSLTLLGATWPQKSLGPAASIPLDLYWRINQPLRADAELHVGLMDQTGEAKQAWFNLSLAETFNPDETTWQPGDIIHTRWQLDLLPEVPPGEYHFELILPDDTTRILPFGALIVEK